MTPQRHRATCYAHPGRRVGALMSAGATRGVIGLVIGVVLGAFVLALPGPLMAQQVLPNAELKRVVGRVEVLSKGQTQWIPAVIGARLAEGDDIRAYSGATAELELPGVSARRPAPAKAKRY